MLPQIYLDDGWIELGFFLNGSYLQVLQPALPCIVVQVSKIEEHPSLTIFPQTPGWSFLRQFVTLQALS